MLSLMLKVVESTWIDTMQMKIAQKNTCDNPNGCLRRLASFTRTGMEYPADPIVTPPSKPMKLVMSG